MGRIWGCRRKYGNIIDFFITENKEYSKDARKHGYRCDRLHEMEKSVFGKTSIRRRRKRKSAKNN